MPGVPAPPCRPPSGSRRAPATRVRVRLRSTGRDTVGWGQRLYGAAVHAHYTTRWVHKPHEEVHRQCPSAVLSSGYTGPDNPPRWRTLGHRLARNHSMTKRIAVIGGGISGVCTACELAKDPRLSVDVIERASLLGGLHRSVCVDGLAFDIGYFIFGEKHDMFLSFPFLKDHFTQVQLRQRTITPRGSVDTYPLTVKTYSQDHGWLGVLYAALDLAVCKLLYRRRTNVPAYAKYHMGRAVYRNSGIQNYLERLYGISDHDVGIEFALQRLSYIKNYPIHRMLSQAFTRERRPAEHTECIYVKPIAGFDAAYGLIQEYLESLGTTVYLNTEVSGVARSEGRFTVTSRSRSHCSHSRPASPRRFLLPSPW